MKDLAKVLLAGLLGGAVGAVVLKWLVERSALKGEELITELERMLARNDFADFDDWDDDDESAYEQKTAFNETVQQSEEQEGQTNTPTHQLISA